METVIQNDLHTMLQITIWNAYKKINTVCKYGFHTDDLVMWYIQYRSSWCVDLYNNLLINLAGITSLD